MFKRSAALGVAIISATIFSPLGLVAAAHADVTGFDAGSYSNPTLTFYDTNLYGQASTDCPGGMSSYHWNFGDGHSESVQPADASSVFHSWWNAGTYTVTVTASDACGRSAQTSFVETVKKDLPPVISVSFSIDSTNPLKIYADPSNTADTDGGVPDPTGPGSYTWYWGDGTSTRTYADSANGFAAHTYAAAGDYPVTVQASDTSYFSSQKIYQISVGSTWRTVEETNGAISYSGVWTLAGCTTTGCSPDHRLTYSKTAGSTAVFHFTGARARWIAPKSSYGGKAAVYVDGVYKTTVSLYQPTYQNGVVVYTTPTLASAAHTLKLKLTVSRRVNIDDFQFLP